MSKTRWSNPVRSSRRRGAALYMTAVLAGILSASLTAALVTAAMVTRRGVDALERVHEAEWIARAGLNWALRRVYSDPNWRTTLPVGPDGLWTASPVTVGGGTFRVWGSDEDGDLKDDPLDPVHLTIEAVVGNTRLQRKATLVPYNRKIISYAGFAWQKQIELKSGASLKGPLRGNSDLTTDGVFTVDVLSGGGFETVTGAKVDSALLPYTSFVQDPLASPSVDVQWYLNRGTYLTGLSGDPIVISRAVFSATRCEYNGTVQAPDPGGVYIVDGGGKQVVFNNCYLAATLVITNSKDVVWTGAFRILDPDNGNPALIVVCGKKHGLRLAPALPLLTEATDLVDYNEDGDFWDSFVTRLRGVVWCVSRIDLEPLTRFTSRGFLSAERLRFSGPVVIKEDLSLTGSPMRGFLGPGLKLSPGSWEVVP